MSDVYCELHELRRRVERLETQLLQRDAQLAVAGAKLASGDTGPDLSEAIMSVMSERMRQNKLWPSDAKWSNTNEGAKLAVLVEEVGEVAKAAMESGELSLDLRTELVQVAAVAVRWVESIDERNLGDDEGEAEHAR